MTTVLDHLEAFAGEIAFGWQVDADERKLPFQVVQTKGGPYPGTTTISTLGLSNFPLPSHKGRSDSKMIRHELLMIVAANAVPPNIVGVLQQVGMEAIERGAAFLHGELIGPRLCRHSRQPKRDRGEIEESQEMAGLSIKARSDPAELLEPGKATLDAIAQAIACPVVGARLLATAWRDHGRRAMGLDPVDQLPAVVTLVRQHIHRGQSLQQPGSLGYVVALPARQQEPKRAPQPIDRHMDLRAQTSSGTPQRRVRRPPFPVAACACARTTLLSIIRYSLLRSRVST